SEGMAAGCSSCVQCREPQWPDRQLRSYRTEAPDRGADGQPRPALWRRFLVSLLLRHGAVRGRSARGGPVEDRAIPGREPEQRARRAWLRPCLLRKRRARRCPQLSIHVAQDLSARRLLLWAFELASLAL